MSNQTTVGDCLRAECTMKKRSRGEHGGMCARLKWLKTCHCEMWVLSPCAVSSVIPGTTGPLQKKEQRTTAENPGHLAHFSSHPERCHQLRLQFEDEEDIEGNTISSQSRLIHWIPAPMVLDARKYYF